MKKIIERGRPLTELVKGSLEYTRRSIATAFYRMFPDTADVTYFVEEIFASFLIVNSYGGGDSALAWDEFYKVAYSQAGETYTFAPLEAWEVVELTYQPKSTPEIAEAKQAAALPAQSQPREQAGGQLVWCEVGTPARVRTALSEVLARLPEPALRWLRARTVLLKAADLALAGHMANAGLDESGAGYIIQVDADRLPSPALLRYTIAHELAHLVQGHMEHDQRMKTGGVPWANIVEARGRLEREVSALLVEWGFADEQGQAAEFKLARQVALASKTI